MTMDEFEERIRELCDDPAALAVFKEQVEGQAVAAKSERKYRARQRTEDPAAAQDISATLRSDAGKALRQRAAQAREQLREEDVPPPRKHKWTAKQPRAKARELCHPASAIRQTRGRENPRCPKLPSPQARRLPRAAGLPESQRLRQV